MALHLANGKNDYFNFNLMFNRKYLKKYYLYYIES